jgi:hypothetical protein
VIDTSTYDDPRRDPEGILHVFVNGRRAVEDGRLLEANAGRVLGGGRQPELRDGGAPWEGADAAKISA